MPRHVLPMLFLLFTTITPSLACGGSKHLMFVSHHGRSHMIPYLEILQPLADRGHRVSIVTEKEAAAWLAPNYPAYELSFFPDALHDPMYAAYRELMSRMIDSSNAAQIFAMVLESVSIPFYSGVANHLRDAFSAGRPDMVLCDFMLDACADMADTLGIKYAVTVASIPPGVNGAPYVNDWLSPYMSSTTEGLNLWQRFKDSFAVPAKTIAAAWKPLAALQQIKDECGVVAPQGPPAVRHAHALKIINTFVGFESARPIDPTMMLVGPIRSHVNSTLPPAIHDWLEQLQPSSRSSRSGTNSSSNSSSTPCVIYVAFGTHVDLRDAVLTHIITALLATLDAGYADGVIWAVSNIKRDKFPANLDPRVLLLPFAPQKALLLHPSVCLFLSHGGAESSHEAMFAAKPMLVVPFYGDQPLNAAKLREAGMAEAIRHNDVTTDRVYALLSRMLNPTSPAPKAYKAAARRMQALVTAHDRTNTAAAANMLEYFAEYGWGHLIPAGTRMPWYKATNADLYAAVLAVPTLVLCGVVLVLRGMVGVARKWLGSSSRNMGTAGGGGSRGNGRATIAPDPSPGSTHMHSELKTKAA